MNYIVNHTGPVALAAVGGKFSRQKTLIDAGFNVPGFFCLSIAFFEKVSQPILSQIKEVLAGIDFSRHPSIVSASRSIQALYTTLSIDELDRETLLSVFDQTFGPDTLVSVRASTVGHNIEESEDSSKNPFAGMSESFLYVRRDALLEKIKLCLASGYSQESLIYRHTQGMNLMGFGVAVGIQKMIFGERSFVMFTSNPKTAAKDTVIAAGYGIGEGVVQEKVEIDHFFVNANSNDIKKSCVHKTRQLGMNTAQGYGLAEFAVPEHLADAPCLTDSEILALAEAGRSIEKHFGEPQDIEGCFTRSGELFFLQSRPISFDYERQKVWTNANVTESFPGVTTALTYSFSRFFYRVIFFDVYRRLGVSNRQLNDNFQSLDKMIGYIHGHVYYCLTSFYLLHKQSPLFPIFRKHWEKMMGFSSSFQTHESLSLKERIGKTVAQARFGAAAASLLYSFSRHEYDFRAFHHWWEHLIAPYRGQNFEGQDPLVLIQRFHQVWTEVGNHWGLTLLNDTYLPIIYGVLEELFKKWRLNEDPGLLSDLLCGDEELRSVEIVLSAVSLAEIVRADSTLSEMFEQLDENALHQCFTQGQLPSVFAEKVKHHLHYFGDRGLQELKLEQPNLRNTPWVLFRMIKQYASQAVTVDMIRQNEIDVRRKADEKLDKLMQDKPRQRLLLKQALKKLRALIRNRENSRYCRSELFGFTKNIFNALGLYFEKQGVLRTAEDIYHLTHEEVFGYIDGTGVTENLQALADLRRAEFEANKAVITPQDITTIGALRQNQLIALSEESATGAGKLQGMGSSAGKVRGIARVVLDPNEPIADTKNMILVARETDPGWMFLMMASKGIVVEKGSMLSHTAITGRKFGIPTVIGLSHATKLIPNGAEIEIDGATGTVTLLDTLDGRIAAVG